jgi:hypothetical protein
MSRNGIHIVVVPDNVFKVCTRTYVSPSQQGLGMEENVLER